MAISLNSTINSVRMSHIKKVSRRSAKLEVASAGGPAERTDYVLSEWEVVALADTGVLSVQEKCSANKGELHYTQVMTAEGQPLDNPRLAIGGVIKVYSYPDHAQYILAPSSRTQPLEEKLGVVEKVEGGNLHLWVWSTDQRMAIPYMLLEQKYQEIDPSTLYNSVIGVKFSEHGRPHSATLVEYRPQPSNTQQGQLSQPQPTTVQLEQGQRQVQQDLRRTADEGVVKEADLVSERWKGISLWLCAYIGAVTQKNPGVGDVSFIQSISSLFNDLNDPSTSEHSNRLRQCQALIEDAGNKQAIEHQLASFGAKMEQSILVEANPPISSPYQHALQQAEDGDCSQCRSRCKLLPFCTHQLCCRCITDSVLRQACCVCGDPRRFVSQLEFLEQSLGGKCDGCYKLKLRMDYCTHKLCKDCILTIKDSTACYICDVEQNQDYSRAVLGYVNFDCAARCGRVKSGLEVISFDCRCVVCIDCVIANIRQPNCFVCGAQRSKSDCSQLAAYQR